MLQLGLLLLLTLSCCHLTVIPNSSVTRLKWLDELKLEGICEMIDICGENVTEEEAESFLTKYEFDPLFKYFLVPDSLSSSEIEKVLVLANKFLATGDVMDGIIEFYFRNVVESKVSPPDLFVLGSVHLELKKFLKKFEFGIKIDEKKITLDGWEVRGEKRRMSLQIFKVLASYSTSITIMNFAIDDNSISIFESAIHSELNQLEFENCPLLFSSENYFDFQHLTSMTHFKFSGCFHKNFIYMLLTIPRDTLTHLDISNVPFYDSIDIYVLMNILLKFNQLKSFSAVFNLLPQYECKKPKLTGNILHLPNLEFLNLRGNLNLISFVNELNQLGHSLKLKHLDISDNRELFNEDLFSNCLWKFPALQSLNLSFLTFQDISTFFTNILQLERLEELHSFEYPYSDDLKKFTKKNHRGKPVLQINGTSWIEQKSLTEINLFKKIFLQDNILNNIPINLLPDQFDTTDLLINDDILSLTSSHLLDIFYSRFKSLKFLRIHFDGSFNKKYFKMLLDNNSIENFELLVYPDCTQFGDLSEIISNRKFKSFTLRIYYRKLIPEEYQRLKEFITALSKGSLWEEMEVFICKSLPIQTVADIMSVAKFKKLREIIFENIYGIEEINISTVIPTVRKVNLTVYSTTNFTEGFNPLRLLKIFPGVTEFKLDIHLTKLNTFPDIYVFENLQSLTIKYEKLYDYEGFVEYLGKHSHLSTLILNDYSSFGHFEFNSGRHPFFSNLRVVWLRSPNMILREALSLN